MTAFYNEIAPYPAAWLRNLVGAGEIAPGVVDERSIADLRPEDVRDHAQAHFFAGIGVWSAALRGAGWPDDVSIWTGSCPCQPFSAAGKKKGTDDARHLWPAFFDLIRECHPPVVVGEQVASPDGLAWLDDVLADLEGAGYSCGASDLCAAGIGAPHLRQRLYFVAIADDHRLEGIRLRLQERRPEPGLFEAGRGGASRVVGNARGPRGGRDAGAVSREERASPEQWLGARYLPHELVAPGATRGAWAGADWVVCTDGKSRPVEPGTFPLVDGSTPELGRDRAARIAGAGNAIVRPLAEVFVASVIDVILGAS